MQLGLIAYCGSLLQAWYWHARMHRQGLCSRWGAPEALATLLVWCCGGCNLLQPPYKALCCSRRQGCGLLAHALLGCPPRSHTDLNGSSNSMRVSKANSQQEDAFSTSGSGESVQARRSAASTPLPCISLHICSRANLLQSEPGTRVSGGHLLCSRATIETSPCQPKLVHGSRRLGSSSQSSNAPWSRRRCGSTAL